MNSRLVILTGLLLAAFTGSGLAQTVVYPPPSLSAPLTTPTVAHQFVTGYPTVGSVLTQAQPAFSDISGTLSTAQCPAGTTGAIGCLEVGGGLAVAAGIVRLSTIATTSHQWFSSVTSGGVLTPTQPAVADLSDGTTGSGTVVLSTSPTLVTPNLGAATATSVNKVAITAPSSSATLALANGVTANIAGNLTTNEALTTTGAGATTLAFTGSTATFTFPTTSGGDTLAGLGFANVFKQAQTVNLNAATYPSLSDVLNVASTDGIATGIGVLATAAAPKLTFYRADTTLASPSVVLTGENVGSLSWKGWNGSTYVSSGQFLGVATENWTGSTNGLEVVVRATPTGTTGTQVEGVFQNGLALGSGAPQGVATVNAPNGFYVGNVNVISSSKAATFAGGLTATIPSTGSALAYACYNSSSGAFTYDNASTCLVSSLRFKHDVVPIKDAVSTVMAFDPIEFTYNDQSNLKGRQVGLSAESVAAADPILATFDDKGRPEKVKYIEVIGLLTAAIQEQQKEINSLKETVAQLKPANGR